MTEVTAFAWDAEIKQPINQAGVPEGNIYLLCIRVENEGADPAEGHVLFQGPTNTVATKAKGVFLQKAGEEKQVRLDEPAGSVEVSPQGFNYTLAGGYILDLWLAVKAGREALAIGPREGHNSELPKPIVAPKPAAEKEEKKSSEPESPLKESKEPASPEMATSAPPASKPKTGLAALREKRGKEGS
ncbi:MAG: hypothetical protein AAB360_01575 [Patescibacteria group bacterium]